MADEQRYITRSERDDLYTELQRKTLHELQRLSGAVWTDYNPSDPGVTIADAVDYALTETDYKLDFALEDYLADKDGTWTGKRFGLYPPEEVYPSAPVTADDYRRLILARFPMVEDAKATANFASRTYDFELRLSPFFTGDRSLLERVGRFLNRHRNLCERIGTVAVQQTEALFFEADFEIETGQQPADLLVNIYWTAMHYLAGSVEIVRPENDGAFPAGADEWYDGPVDDMRVDIPAQRNTETELYLKLRQLPGIVSFKTCYFKDNANRIITDFSAGYSLQLPETFRHITVRIKGKAAEPDMQEFREKLHARYFMHSTFRLRSLLYEQENSLGKGNRDGHNRERSGGTTYRAAYRNVYAHTPIARDLPSHYATSERDFRRDTPARTRADIRNFGHYLKLFDLVLMRGLQELDGLKRVLDIEHANDEPLRMPLLPPEEPAARKEKDRYRPIAALRNRYMDFLDGLYGAESDPVWLQAFDCYGQSAEDRLRRRMRFLRELPRLIRDRFVSFDLTGPYGGENVPVVKRYLSLLLDFNGREENAAGNVLPSHNLMLMGDGAKGRRLRDAMNACMIDDGVFATAAVEAIEPDEPPRTEQERLDRNEELRRHSPIFHSNWISGSLFREGIVLRNYHLVKVDHREWILVFRGKEKEHRMNLGRSDDKEQLKRWANTLCRYLRELNRACEAMYAIEKNLLLGLEHSDTVMLACTGWTARTHSPLFRAVCARWARSIVPAHLNLEIYWLDATQMQYFEECHRKWRKCLQQEAPVELRAVYERRMMRILAIASYREAHRSKDGIRPDDGRPAPSGNLNSNK